jgi:hypothetical protein
MFFSLSKWRFGAIWHFRELYVEENERGNYQEILDEVMKTLQRTGEIKLAMVRILHRANLIKFKGGRLDDYYKMGI